jgi:hypothetical protein
VFQTAFEPLVARLALADEMLHAEVFERLAFASDSELVIAFHAAKFELDLFVELPVLPAQISFQLALVAHAI